MKVLQLTNSLKTGGAEKLLADTVPLYQQAGLTVDVLLLDGSDTPLLRQLQNESSGAVFLSKYQSVYNPLQVFFILPFLKKYDIVHVHLFPALYWSALAKMLSFSNVRLVYTEHSTSNRRRGKWYAKWLDRFIYKHYKTIVTIADQVDQNIKAHLDLPENRFVKIYNGVDTTAIAHAFPHPKDAFFDAEAFMVLQVSSFRFPKDQPTLIKALAMLPEKVKLLLVGEGPEKDASEKLVAELALQHRVAFLGLRIDTPRLLRTADLIVLSSRHEGLSLSSIEGMASGKPFVASDAPGLREVVQGAGILFETGNESALALAIAGLVEDTAYAQAIARQCQERAQKYDVKPMIEGYLKVYKTLMQSGR